MHDRVPGVKIPEVMAAQAVAAPVSARKPVYIPSVFAEAHKRLHAKNAQLNLTIKNQQSELEALKSQVDVLTTSNAEINAVFTHATASYNQLRMLHDALSRHHEKLKNDLAEINKDKNKITQEADDANAQNNLVIELGRLRDVAHSLKTENDNLRVNNQQLNEQLNLIKLREDKIATGIDRIKVALDAQWGPYINNPALIKSSQSIFEKALQVKAVIDYIHNMLWVTEDTILMGVPVPAPQTSSTNDDAAVSLTILSTAPTCLTTKTTTPAAMPMARTIATSNQSLFNHSVPSAKKRKHQQISPPTTNSTRLKSRPA